MFLFREKFIEMIIRNCPYLKHMHSFSPSSMARRDQARHFCLCVYFLCVYIDFVCICQIIWPVKIQHAKWTETVQNMRWCQWLSNVLNENRAILKHTLTHKKQADFCDLSSWIWTMFRIQTMKICWSIVDATTNNIVHNRCICVNTHLIISIWKSQSHTLAQIFSHSFSLTLMHRYRPQSPIQHSSRSENSWLVSEQSHLLSKLTNNRLVWFGLAWLSFPFRHLRLESGRQLST